MSCNATYKASYYSENRSALLAEQKEYRWQHKDRLREYHAARYAANKEPVREQQKAYYFSNRDTLLTQQKDYREQHKDRLRDYFAAYYRANRDKKRAYDKAYLAANRSKIVDRVLRWREANKDKTVAFAAKWRRSNQHTVAATGARRRAAKLQATPKWADQYAIAVFYADAAAKTKATGIRHDVDHIVPLQSPIVCGLHCEANLEVLTAKANQEKGNRWWPDMPDPER